MRSRSSTVHDAIALYDGTVVLTGIMSSLVSFFAARDGAGRAGRLEEQDDAAGSAWGKNEAARASKRVAVGGARPPLRACATSADLWGMTGGG